MARLGTLVTILIVLVLLAAACAPAAPPPTPVPQAQAAASPTPLPKPTATPVPPTPTKRPPEKVKLAHSSFSMSNLPYFMARDKGYFAEEGLDVELVQLSGAVSVKALIGGSHEFDSSLGSAKAAILEGAPLKAIFATSVRIPFYIYGKPSIKSLAQLKGTRVGLGRTGSSPHITASIAMRKYGVDPEKDVAWMMVGSDADRITALRVGTVDAVVVNPEQALQLDDMGFNRLVAIGDEVPGITGGLATQDKMVKERPDTVKRMVRATLKGLKYARTQSPEARAYVEKYGEQYLQVDKAMANRLYDIRMNEWGETGWLPDEPLKADLEIQKQELGVKEDIPLSKLYDLSFIKAADQELKGWKP